MSNFDENVIAKLKRLEREVERLKVGEKADSADFATAGHDHDSAYLGITAQAADSAKLGNVAAASYLQTPSWTSFTPTITWAGGATNPTTVTVLAAEYFQMGKAVLMMVAVQITRGSGDRSYFQVAPPVAVSAASTGSCTHNLVTSAFTAAGVYYTGGAFNANFGTMARDGYLWLTAFYKAS